MNTSIFNNLVRCFASGVPHLNNDELSNEIHDKDKSNEIQNNELSDEIHDKDKSNEIQNNESLNEIQNNELSDEIHDKDKSNEIQNNESLNEIQNKNKSNEIQDNESSNEIQNDDESNEIQNDKSNEIQDNESSNEIQNDDESNEIKLDNSLKKIQLLSIWFNNFSKDHAYNKSFNEIQLSNWFKPITEFNNTSFSKPRLLRKNACNTRDDLILCIMKNTSQVKRRAENSDECVKRVKL